MFLVGDETALNSVFVSLDAVDDLDEGVVDAGVSESRGEHVGGTDGVGELLDVCLAHLDAVLHVDFVTQDDLGCVSGCYPAALGLARRSASSSRGES